MKFLPVSGSDRTGMLRAIGAPSIEALREIARETDEDPAFVLGAPCTTPVGRVDKVAAARDPVLRRRLEDHKR